MGDILINGHRKEAKSFKRIMGYVEQNDIHMPYSTVSEALHFAAMLRLPASVNDQQRERFVEGFIDLLELREVSVQARGCVCG